MEEFLNQVLNWLKTQGLKIVIGFLVFWLCCKIINVISKKLDKRLENSKADPTIRKISISLGRKALKVLLFVTYIGYIGIETSSIAAAIASIAITIGLALQGSLSNLAGGVVILMMRPYRIGDFIENNGVAGTVEDIGLFYTQLVTVDNKTIFVPNAKTSDSTTINYSMKKVRRLDLVFSISYSNDFRKAKRILYKVIEQSGLAKDLPAAPFVNISKHNESSIDLVVRIWVNSQDYWDLNWFMLEKVKLEFDKNNISIPFNQMDIHIIDKETSKPIDDEDELVIEESEKDEKDYQAKLDAKKAKAGADKKAKEIEKKKLSSKLKKIVNFDK